MTTFRNGDRVKVVNNNSIRRDLTGKTGTVEDAKDPREVVVRVDDEGYAMYFDSSELALAADPRDDALDEIRDAYRDMMESEDDDVSAFFEVVTSALAGTGREVWKPETAL